MLNRFIVALLTFLLTCLAVVSGCDQASPSPAPPGARIPPAPAPIGARAASDATPGAPSAPSAVNMLAEYQAALDRLLSADQSNEFKLDEARKAFEQKVQDLNAKWVGQWVTAELAVAQVSKGGVLFTSPRIPEWNDPWGGARLYIDEEATHEFRTDDLGPAAFPMFRSDILAWGHIPRDVSATAAKEWSAGDHVSARVLVRRVITGGRSDGDPWLINIGAVWATDTQSTMEVLEPALAAKIARDRQRRAKVAAEVERVRAYATSLEPHRATRVSDRPIAPYADRLSDNEVAEALISVVRAGDDAALRAVLAADPGLRRWDNPPSKPAEPPPPAHGAWKWEPRRVNAANSSDRNGFTALHYAVLVNRPTIVKMLVESVLNPADHTGVVRAELAPWDPSRDERAKDPHVSALHLAAMLGHVECLDALLPANIPAHAPWRVNADTRQPWRGFYADEFLSGSNPFHVEGDDLKTYTRNEWAPELDSEDVPAKRMDPGDPNYNPFGGTSPIFAFHYTINEPDVHGLTPLDYARIFRQKAAEAALVEAGAKGLIDPADLPVP